MLDGGTGMDEIDGRRGDDTLRGGDDADMFVFGKARDADVVEDFEDGVDTLLLRGTNLEPLPFSTFAQLEFLASENGTDLVIDLSGGDVLTIRNFSLSEFDETDVSF